MSPPVHVGAWMLFRAREHLDADAMKIFEAVVRAMQLDEARAQARRAPDQSASVDLDAD